MPTHATRTGVMLVGHGTRDARGTEQFLLLAERLQRLVAPIPVAPCLLEFQEPTIDQAWRRLVGMDVQHVRVVPLLLFEAGHAKHDIPSAVRAAAANTSWVTFDQAQAIACQKDLVELVQLRLTTVLKMAGSADQTVVVMVGRGNRDESAQAEMRALTNVIRSRNARIEFRTAFYAMAEPPLQDILDELASSQRYKTIIVQPHLLFAGRLYDAIKEQVSQTQSRFPEMKFEVAHYLGPEDLVARALVDRIGLSLGVDSP